MKKRQRKEPPGEELQALHFLCALHPSNVYKNQIQFDIFRRQSFRNFGQRK
jgi:hypothetical protein